MNSLTKKEHKELGFKVGPTWRSFEKFRTVSNPVGLVQKFQRIWFAIKEILSE